LLLLTITLGVGISFALSRFRYPLVPVLIPLAVLALQVLAQTLRTRQWRRLRPALLALPAALLLTQALPAWGLRGSPIPLPPKPSHAALPTDAIALGLRFGDELELVGWRPHPAWQAARHGYIDVGQAYAVELFWRALQAPTQRYKFYLKYLLDGETLALAETHIGAVSFPPYYTLDWPVGTIFSELVAFRLDAPLPRNSAGQVRLGVYYAIGEDPETFDYADLTLVNVPVSAPLAQADWLLDELASYPEATLSHEGPPAWAFGGLPGDSLHLLRYSLPAELKPDEALTLAMLWMAEGEISLNYQMFLHVMDEDGALAAQGDGQPVAGLPTRTWKPGQPLEARWTLEGLPEGLYRVYIGLIDAETGERLDVLAPDRRPLLGEVRVSR
jgi:hypothetical protein